MSTDQIASFSPVSIEILILRADSTGTWSYRRLVTSTRQGESPDQAARRASGLGEEAGDITVHSTSWRYQPDGQVVLTYAVCPDPASHLPATELHELRVARGDAPAAPTPGDLTVANVAAHAIRHLAFLKITDLMVRETLERTPEIAAALDQMSPALAGGLTTPTVAA
ncbi:hypothetical protein [Sphaerisporangium fuscum]|uniref:hypothetical protein n=1 Tax=Sphaerisporangium fuscum TaxID=2835868 RepID=UPI001BDD29AE|nr:hypothetical protein [Sphaerisporangium fuscum]